MKRLDSSTVNRISLERTEKWKPNFSDFDNGKEFMELFDSEIAFAQVFFYDKTKGNNLERTNFNLNLEKYDLFIEAVNTYNENLERAQKDVLDELQVDEYDRRNYLYFNRIGDDLGIAHFHIYVRDKRKEREEEMNCSHDTEPKGPYGGAFRDMRDFANHVGIRLTD